MCDMIITCVLAVRKAVNDIGSAVHFADEFIEVTWTRSLRRIDFRRCSGEGFEAANTAKTHGLSHVPSRAVTINSGWDFQKPSRSPLEILATEFKGLF